MTRFLFCLAAVSLTTGAAIASSPWAQLAKDDLKAIHTLLTQNHPGTKDSQNTWFREQLEKGYKEAERQVETVQSYVQYESLLDQYVSGFNDGHLRIHFLLVPKSTLKEKSNAPHLEFSVSQLTKETAWIRLPYFDPKAEQIQKLKSLIKSASKLRKQKAIVFDLRNNGGGNSAWGYELLTAVYGKAFLEHQSYRPEQTYAEWRVSPGNVEHLKRIVKQMNEEHGETSEASQGFQKVLEKMEKALAENKDFASTHDPEEAVSPAPPRAAPLSQARPILLTDGVCFSACLDFMDVALTLPNALHVGARTGADTLYMEVRSEPLPSTLAKLTFSTKVYRNRKRGHNVAYTPSLLYPGDLTDTKAVKRWIIKKVPDSH